ncbi:MAG: tRNA (N(6)-L-threonylcarbamoyladenosine(37)-C(2))-methylthiotransferase MtaB [Spirochaetes bacterium]|nr:tRNA (N(6)-L-threonylcarbamoyladenosine(37)-C(2))-methylthiotransferase MtaB [Spirochaetota bacterium]
MSKTSVVTKTDLLSGADRVHPRTSVLHFGCRLNQFETDGIKTSLTANAHTLTADLREADFVVVNTCTVTNKADYKNRAAIRRAHRLNPQAKIIVTGCYATTDAEELRALPGVYRVVGNDHKHKIADMLSGNESEAATPNNRFSFSAQHEFKSRATLKIQDGCNKSCSYCKIPQARGRGTSRSFEDTLDAAKRLVDAGFGELVLTGVNIGWYEDAGKSFYALVEAILNLPGNFHLRISSIEPGDVTERFAAFYAHPKMARFLHIPVQSGSKFVLRTMRRGYTPERFFRRIEDVRKVCPEVHIGTDIIVGFPAEGEAEFEETLALSHTANFANIHIFPFSKRRNTPIVQWLERREKSPAMEKRSYSEVNGAMIRERIARLAALKTTLAESYAAACAGMNVAAICERHAGGRIEFLTENYLRGAIAESALGHGVERGERFKIVWSNELAVKATPRLARV